MSQNVDISLSNIAASNSSNPATSIRERQPTPASVSNNKPRVEISISKWSTGSKALTLMYLSYVLALTLAITHFFLFRYLDGKLASDIHLSCHESLTCVVKRAIPQAYVSTAAIFLSNTFSVVIRITLAIAFTQYLWKILRKSALKISTIESLFNMRSNIFDIFQFSVIKTSWILVIIALVIYLVPIAASLPPGALTVILTNSSIVVPAIIPTLNASHVHKNMKSPLVTFLPSGNGIKGYRPSHIFADLLSGINPLNKLAASTSFNGEPLGFRSPCGPNCTYTFEFEGPYLRCTESTANLTLKVARGTVFSIFWSPSNPFTFYSDDIRPSASVFSPAVLNAIVNNMPTIHSSHNYSVETSSISCIPMRSLYNVTNSYTNNIQTINYTTKPLARLLRTNKEFEWQTMSEWNQVILEKKDDRNWYRDSQLMGIIAGIAYVINGSCSSEFSYIRIWKQTISSSIFSSWSSSHLSCNGSGASLVPYTKLRDDIHNYTAFWDPIFGTPISFTITEKMLNSLLANLTFSIISALNPWNETINVTQSPSQNTYEFSHPTNLILPYSLTLLLTLPILILGTLALRGNGVPAADGGFIQILSTTTGSRQLQKAAATHCLGGVTDSRSDCLMNLEIKYGELIGEEVRVGGTFVRRAGFGLKDEVVALKKGEKYGVVHDGTIREVPFTDNSSEEVTEETTSN